MSKRVRLYEYIFNDEKYIIVYDSYRTNPVTILFWDNNFLKENSILYKNKKYYDIK
jgi:adenine specific DNA methylase Mod